MGKEKQKNRQADIQTIRSQKKEENIIKHMKSPIEESWREKGRDKHTDSEQHTAKTVQLQSYLDEKNLTNTLTNMEIRIRENKTIDSFCLIYFST